MDSVAINRPTSAATLADGITLETNAASKMQLSDNILQNIAELNVGVVLALNSSLFNPSQAQPEYFSSITGTEGMVNSASSTATYDITAKEYTDLLGGTPETDSVSGAFGSSSASTTLQGHKIHINADCVLLKITKAATSNHTTAKLLDSAYNLIASAAFSGNDATFNCLLRAGMDFHVGADGGTTLGYTAGGAYPHNNTLVNFTGGFTATSVDSADRKNIVSVYVAPATASNAIIQTNAMPALNGTFRYVRLSAYNKTLPSGASLTFDLAVDGTTYAFTSKDFNSWVDLTTPQTFSGAKVKINFVKGASSTIAAMKGFCVMVD